MIIIRNILAVIAGIVLGSVVNGGLISLGPSLIPPPEGVNVQDMESLKSTMHLFQPKHFLFPFLAHALGTLVGAFAAALIAATHKMRFAIAISLVFLVGGIMMVVQLPAPMWFNFVDLVFAYLPMGFIAGKAAAAIQKKN